MELGLFCKKISKTSSPCVHERFKSVISAQNSNPNPELSVPKSGVPVKSC